MNVRIVAGVTDAEGHTNVPEPTVGTIRGVCHLWIEQPPPAPPGLPVTETNLYLVIGDGLQVTGNPNQQYGQAVKLGDVQRIGGYEQILTDRGLSIDDYTDPTKTFNTDLALPASLLAGYTG